MTENVQVRVSDRYVIRQARTDDSERLVELLLALQDHLESSNPDLWRMSEESRWRLKGQLLARLQAPASCALVAEEQNDGVVGMIFGRVVSNARYMPSAVGIVDQAFVTPGHRRRGVGLRLVAGLCSYFARHGIDDLSLRYVQGNDEARGFWTALGFAPRIVTVGADRHDVEMRLACKT